MAMALTSQRALRELRVPVMSMSQAELVCAYQSLGDRQVKNITDPVTVYRVLPDPAAVVRARKTRLRVPAGMLAALAVGAMAGVAGWYWLDHERRAQAPLAETTTVARAPPQSTAP